MSWGNVELNLVEVVWQVSSGGVYALREGVSLDACDVGFRESSTFTFDLRKSEYPLLLVPDRSILTTRGWTDFRIMGYGTRSCMKGGH